MSISKKLQAQVRRKNKEIQQLELDRQELDVKIREAYAHIAGLEEAMKHLTKDEKEENPAVSLRKGKSIAQIYDILKQSGEAMHIKDILAAMGKITDKKSQQATGSQLNNYVREGRIFTRDLPNTFGLKEWGAKSPTSSESAEGVQTGLPLPEED